MIFDIRGKEPSITGPEAKGCHKESEQWTYPKLDPSQYEKKVLLAACLGVAVHECFRSHTYMFAGEIFRQLVGGGIGLRLTGVVAKMRMTRWARMVLCSLKALGVTVWLLAFYVDDVRIVCSPIPRGYKWHQHTKPVNL